MEDKEKTAGTGADMSAALEEAIQGWQEMADGDGISNRKVCPLCVLADSDCGGCPVKEAGYKDCEGTPYIEWFDYVSRVEYGGDTTSEESRDATAKAKELAQAVADFLRSLQCEGQRQDDHRGG